MLSLPRIFCIPCDRIWRHQEEFGTLLSLHCYSKIITSKLKAVQLCKTQYCNIICGTMENLVGGSIYALYIGKQNTYNNNLVASCCRLPMKYCRFEQVQVMPNPFCAIYYREKRLPQRISAVGTCIQFPHNCSLT